MTKILKKFVLFLIASVLSASFTSCEGDDNTESTSTSNILGTWLGIRTYINPVSGRKYQYLTVIFDENQTGSLEYETPSYIGQAFFNYSISGNVINCQGAYANSDDDVYENYSISFRKEGDRLITEKYGGVILTRDGSVMVDSEGNEITDLNSHVEAPTFEKYLTTTDYTGFTIKLRFNNGGDSYENMKCQVYWRAYSKKPSTTPTEQDMTNSESMGISDHNDSTNKTIFEKSHYGYNGGTYIYYYAVCENSKGSCKTDLSYTIIPRL